MVHFPRRAGEGLRAPVVMVVSPRPERAGQADQDGRPSGAALPSIDLSVVRGVGSSMVVPGSVGSYRPTPWNALPLGKIVVAFSLKSLTRIHRMRPGLRFAQCSSTHNPYPKMSRFSLSYTAIPGWMSGARVSRIKVLAVFPGLASSSTDLHAL